MCDDYHDDRHSITIANRHPSLTFRATEFRHGPVAPAIGKNGQVMDLNNTIKKSVLRCFGRKAQNVIQKQEIKSRFI